MLERQSSLLFQLRFEPAADASETWAASLPARAAALWRQMNGARDRQI